MYLRKEQLKEAMERGYLSSNHFWLLKTISINKNGGKLNEPPFKLLKQPLPYKVVREKNNI
jgi:hypothetical protein